MLLPTELPRVHVTGLGSFLPLHSFCTLSASVLYTCIFMYILHVQCMGRYRGAGGGQEGTPSFHSGGLTPPLSCANCRLHTLPRMCIVKILQSKNLSLYTHQVHIHVHVIHNPLQVHVGTCTLCTIQYAIHVQCQVHL